MKPEVSFSWNKGYKDSSKKLKLRECILSDSPISTIVVDFRSRLFRYIRLVVKNRSLKDKVMCIFRILQQNINVSQFSFETENQQVFDSAIKFINVEVSALMPKKRIYVFPSETVCSYKKETNNKREVVAKEKYNNLITRLNIFKKDLFNLEMLVECHFAFESYLFSNLDELSLMYTSSKVLAGIDYVVPDANNYFESDRMCATLRKSESADILSEDLDCLSLFGSELIIKDVYNKFFSYYSLKDLMSVFNANNRKELVHKCCICGTDYNYGIKNTGYVTAAKIDAKKAESQFKYCIGAQPSRSIKDIQDFYKFLLLDQ